MSIKKIDTEFDAKQFILCLLDTLGGGYHPDNPLDDYFLTNDDGDMEDTFTKEEALHLEELHDQSLSLIRIDVYEFCMRVLKEAPTYKGRPEYRGSDHSYSKEFHTCFHLDTKKCVIQRSDNFKTIETMRMIDHDLEEGAFVRLCHSRCAMLNNDSE